jgi:hypothetical protein
LEHNAIPLSALAVNDSALTGIREASEWALEDNLALVRTFDILTAVAYLLTTCSWPRDTEEIVHSVVLDYAATFMQTIRLALKFENLVHTTFFLCCKVRLKFHETDVAATGEYIHTTVIVEEKGRVVVCRKTAMQLPALCRVVGLEDHRLMRVVVSYEESPERSLVIAKRGSPLSATIYRTFIKIIAWCVLNGIC